MRAAVEQVESEARIWMWGDHRESGGMGVYPILAD